MSETGLLNPASIRRIADQIGLRPTKTRGQNFVHDANTVRRIVSLAQVGAADRVIEVGPGLGSLTLGLLETCLLYTSPSPRDGLLSRMPSSA